MKSTHRTSVGTRRALFLVPVAAGLALGTLALAGCSSTTTEATKDNPFALTSPGTLTVCSDVPYAPFEIQDSDKKIVGFDMDIADALARDLNVSRDVKVTGFEQIKSGSALQANDCDVAISSISITDERKTKMDFSDPYYADDLGLMVPVSSAVKNLDDAAKATVGVQAGTTGADFAKKKGIKATEFKDSGLLVQALKAGTVDAAIGNTSTLGYTAGKDSRLHFVERYTTGENLGIAVKKGNAALLEQVDKTLAAYRDSGKLKASQARWFEGGSN